MEASVTVRKFASQDTVSKQYTFQTHYQIFQMVIRVGKIKIVPRSFAMGNAGTSKENEKCTKELKCGDGLECYYLELNYDCICGIQWVD